MENNELLDLVRSLLRQVVSIQLLSSMYGVRTELFSRELDAVRREMVDLLTIPSDPRQLAHKGKVEALQIRIEQMRACFPPRADVRIRQQGAIRLLSDISKESMAAALALEVVQVLTAIIETKMEQLDAHPASKGNEDATWQSEALRRVEELRTLGELLCESDYRSVGM